MDMWMVVATMKGASVSCLADMEGSGQQSPGPGGREVFATLHVFIFRGDFSVKWK